MKTKRRDLLEILDDRYQQHSTIVTSQLPVAHWHEHLNDATLVDTILDRLLHNTIRLELHPIFVYGPIRFVKSFA